MNVLYILYAIVFFFSMLMGVLVLPRIVSISKEKNLMDAPDQRKVHSSPTPRLGGISFLPITLMSVFLFNVLCVLVLHEEVSKSDTQAFLKMQALGIGSMLLYLVGIADDLVGVNFKAKFAAQIVAGLLFPICGLSFHNILGQFGLYNMPAIVDYAITVFMVVYITNAINLIDGVDGLASGICILAFTLYAVMFLFLNHPFMASTCLSILGVLIVFFVFNVFGGEHHSLKKLFMGDTGSLTLGYFISFLILSLTSYQNTRALVYTGVLYMVFSPLVIPLLDIIRVVWARYRDRVPLFLPDKRHIHHKLLRTGLSARATMVTLLVMTLYFIGLNILLPQYMRSRWVVIGNVLSWIAMHLIINFFIKRKAKEDKSLEERYANKKNTINDKKSFDL